VGQSVKGVFQGEIMGASPFILCIESEEESVAGFFKYLSDSTIVSLEGTVDGEGNMVLKGTKKPYQMFLCRLQNRTIQGSFTPSERAHYPYAFYAVDLRGEYMNIYYEGFRISLSENGYIMKDMMYSKEGLITTRTEGNGKIYLQCDSLNAKLYVENDTLRVDTLYGRPSFIWKRDIVIDEERQQFMLQESFWNGESFAEFPEKNEKCSLDKQVIKLNNTYSSRIKQISRSEYLVRKWESAHLRHKPYKAVTDTTNAKKMLHKRMKITVTDPEEYSFPILELSCKDGGRRRIDWFEWKYSFIAYYPELNVLILNHEADGDYPVDLNDCAKEHVGNPRYDATSPDKRLRISGLSPGGAADGMEYFLEVWNKSKKKYEFVNYLGGEHFEFNFNYADGWFWTGNNKALFVQNMGGDSYCYEMEIVEN